MNGGIEIRELIFKATVEDGNKKPSKVKVGQSNANLSRSTRESIINECLDRMKEYLRDNIER